MLIEADANAFSGLSLTDLLVARDQFHVHLMKKENVVGTAVGRYLIRKSDPLPPAENPPGAKEPRTLENSAVREYSWPCVLVLVEKWLDENQFLQGNALSNYIPKAIYLPDGRSVPICVVLAPPVTKIARSSPTEGDDEDEFSGGMTIHTKVQGVTRRAALGCLVSDGHKVYGLTNRHVCGQPGTEIFAGQHTASRIGVSSAKQLGRSKFTDVYPGWPGDNVYVQLDAALVELDHLPSWRATVAGIGPLGSLADLSVHNLSLKMIDTPVRAHGAVGGDWLGRIAAMFYRFKSVAGFEYVADFLIGSRDEKPLHTVPGDSGTLIVVDCPVHQQEDRMPIALQWGGAVFAADSGPHPFALATNLSTICRDLEVDIYRGQDHATFEYWGPVGHYSVGGFACRLPSNANLLALMKANRTSIGYDDDGELSPGSFRQLADVPDTVWKSGSRKRREGPTHYADMDLPDDNGQTLHSLTPDAHSLNPNVWIAFYDRIGFTSSSQRGLLPFRVWQIYKKMVSYVESQNVTKFVAAAGILAHYVGDAAQPLHGSMYDDGDPRRNPDGTPSTRFLGHGQAFAHGVHSAYESRMLDENRDEFQQQLKAALPAAHGMSRIIGVQAAGFAAIELIRRCRSRIDPFSIVQHYGNLVTSHQTSQAPTSLWQAFGIQTVNCIVDSCRTLAMLWESAWIEGNGNAIPASELGEVSRNDLKALYNRTDPEFLPSTLLDDIPDVL